MTGALALLCRVPLKVGDDTIGGVSGEPGGPHDEAGAAAETAKVADQLN